MDRFLNAKTTVLRFLRSGGALGALPFFLFAAVFTAPCPGAGAPSQTTLTGAGSEDPNLDAGMRVIFTKPSELDSIASSLGYPTAGGIWMMYGGGATITPGELRIQFSAWSGSLDAGDGTRSTEWDLKLAALNLEQRYLMSSFLVTGGVSLEAGQLLGFFSDSSDAQLTSVEAPLFGYSVQAGVRWPAQTKLGLFIRGGWEWLQGGGNWRGTEGPSLGSTLFELGGPTLTAQLELSF